MADLAASSLCIVDISPSAPTLRAERRTGQPSPWPSVHRARAGVSVHGPVRHPDGRGGGFTTVPGCADGTGPTALSAHPSLECRGGRWARWTDGQGDG